MEHTTATCGERVGDAVRPTPDLGNDHRICDVLATAPQRVWSVREILEALAEPYSLEFSRRCVVLWHSGRIERFGPAQYRHRSS